MAWGKLASETLTTTADNLSSGTITANKFIQVMANRIPSGSTRFKLSFNNDSGNNYSQRASQDGGSDGTDTGIPFLESVGDQTIPTFHILNIVNISSEEKLVIQFYVIQNTAGAGTAPGRVEHTGKWTNTSSQITEIDFDNTSGGDFASDTNISVLGTD